MGWREQLIRYQNTAEANYAQDKSWKHSIHYFLAFLIFISSTLLAAFTIPFRYLGRLGRKKEHASNVISVKQENFQDLLSNHPLILVDFWAEWCGPCIMMNPILDKFMAEQTELILAKVNADVSSELLKKYQVRGIPQFILFHDGNEIKRHAGPMTFIELEQFCRVS